MKGIGKIAVLQAACLLMTGGAGMLPAEPLTVFAADKTVSGTYNGMTYEDYGTRCMINGFTSELPADLVIPEKIGDMTVEWVGEEAFKGCTKLRSVTIPKTVGYVLEGSFVNCTDLETVTFSERTERVHFFDNPFAGTKWYAAKKAENPLVVADRSVIDGKSCSGAVKVPDGVEEIVTGAFAENTALTGITLPETLAVIGKEAFRGSGLKEISIPGGAETVEAKAFQSCTALTAASFGEGVRIIEQYAFESCTSLQTVKFPESLQEIRLYAFHQCGKLGSVVLPGRLRTVGAGAFTFCTALQEVTCLNYYTMFAGSKASADVNTDNGVSISNNGEYSKKFTYTGVVKGYADSLPSMYAKNLGMRFQSLGDAPLTGKCAPEMFWAVDGDTLHIEGTGKMDDYGGYDYRHYDSLPEWYYLRNVAPWFMYRDQIKYVVVGAYVEQTSSGAFRDLPVLEKVSFMNPKCWPSGSVSNGVNEEGTYYYNGVIAGFNESEAHGFADRNNYRFERLDPPENAYQRGDVTGDGDVSIDDVQNTLKEYTECLSGKAATFSEKETTAADVDESGKVSIEDVQLILKYYTENTVAGKHITWEELMK